MTQENNHNERSSATTSIIIMYDGCQGEVPEAEAPETPWEGGGGREVSKDESLVSLDGQYCV